MYIIAKKTSNGPKPHLISKNSQDVLLEAVLWHKQDNFGFELRDGKNLVAECLPDGSMNFHQASHDSELSPVRFLTYYARL